MALALLGYKIDPHLAPPKKKKKKEYCPSFFFLIFFFFFTINFVVESNWVEFCGKFLFIYLFG